MISVKDIAKKESNTTYNQVVTDPHHSSKEAQKSKSRGSNMPIEESKQEEEDD